MSLFSRILWFLAFLVATFCWMVLFEHGFSMKAFSAGVKEELRELAALVTRGAGESKSGSGEPGSAKPPVDGSPSTPPAGEAKGSP